MGAPGVPEGSAGDGDLNGLLAALTSNTVPLRHAAGSIQISEATTTFPNPPPLSLPLVPSLSPPPLPVCGGGQVPLLPSSVVPWGLPPLLIPSPPRPCPACCFRPLPHRDTSLGEGRS